MVLYLGHIFLSTEATPGMTCIAGSGLTEGEVRFLIDHEKARKLADVLQRRQSLAITGRLSGSVIRGTAQAMAGVLGWDAARVNSEVAGFVFELVNYHGVSPEVLGE